LLPTPKPSLTQSYATRLVSEVWSLPASGMPLVPSLPLLPLLRRSRMAHLSIRESDQGDQHGQARGDGHR